MTSPFLESVVNLINEYGNDDYSLVSITSVTDPSDPTNTINTESLDPIQSFEGQFSAYKIASGIVEKDDINLCVDPSSLAYIPKVTDKLKNGSTYYTIKDIQKFKDKDTIYYYEFQIRA